MPVPGSRSRLWPRVRPKRLIVTMSVTDAPEGSARTDSDGPPGWAGKLLCGLLLYVVAGSVWMVTGWGGERVTHYVGLLSDGLPNLVTVLLCIVATRRTPAGLTRKAWTWLSLAMGLYLVGSELSVASWLRDRDPFPGISDIFFVAFYPAVFAASFYLIKAAAVRVTWLQLSLDATIFVMGFGAFFWFLVIRPVSSATEVDVLKQALSQGYLALNCIILLTLGVLLLSGSADKGGRRIALLLLAGFAIMFLGDILWSLAKVGGYYLPGGLQDVLYITCYAPIAAAAREQMKGSPAADRAVVSGPDAITQALPYAAMLSAFLVLVYFTRAYIGGPATEMTMIVFSLTLLMMVRQALNSREVALTRERRAARIVEDRYASLIANSADVIMIVGADGALRFVSPASQRMFGLSPQHIAGRSLLDLWQGEEAVRINGFLAEVAATPTGPVGPVEVCIQRGPNRYVLEVVGSNLTADAAIQGFALNFRDISERKALEEQLRQLAFHDSLTLLANRNLFRDRVHHALALTRRTRSSIAVLFLDLDDFKYVNDSLGHDAGDRLLQAAAQRLVKSTRTSDTVARLGGDEFGVLLEDIGAAHEAQSVAQSMIAALSVPFTLGGTQVRVAASVGIAFSTPDMSTEALLSNADIAMYHAKSAGKSRHVTFEPRMQELLHERLRLEADMSRALKNQEFFLEY